MFRQQFLALIILLGVIATACSNANNDIALDNVPAPEVLEAQESLALADETETTTTIEATATTAVAPTTTETTTTTTTTSGPIDISTTTIDVTPSTVLLPLPVSSCETPSLEHHFVNVAPDNNGGNLNARRFPGTDADVADVLTRGTTAFTLGVCRTVDETNWWAILGSDGDPAWVAGQFLSAEPVLDPGIGNAIAGSEYVGLSAETLNVVVANIATSLGLPEAVVIDPSEVTDQVGSEFSQTFTLTGLSNESTNGFQVSLRLMNTLSEDAAQLVSVTVVGAEVRPLCSRGVSPEGLCI